MLRTCGEAADSEDEKRLKAEFEKETERPQRAREKAVNLVKLQL